MVRGRPPDFGSGQKGLINSNCARLFHNYDSVDGHGFALIGERQGAGDNAMARNDGCGDRKVDRPIRGNPHYFLLEKIFLGHS